MKPRGFILKPPSCVDCVGIGMGENYYSLKHAFILNSGIGARGTADTGGSGMVIPVSLEFHKLDSYTFINRGWHFSKWNIFLKSDLNPLASGKPTSLSLGLSLQAKAVGLYQSVFFGPAAWTTDKAKAVFESGLESTALGLHVGLEKLGIFGL